MGQRSYQDFVVTTTGDTLRGNLIISGRAAVKLRQPGGGRAVFSPAEARSYGDKTGVIGLSQTVGVHGQPQFMVPLVQGPVSLFAGIDKQGDKAYFLQVPDTTYLIGISRQTAQLTFHRLLSDCSSLEFGTMQTQNRYPVTYQGLTRLIMDYNACTKPQETSRVVKSATNFKLSYGLKAGVNTGDFALSYEAYPGEVKDATGYQAGLFLEATNKTHFSLVLEAMYLALRGSYGPGIPSPSSPTYSRLIKIDYTQVQIPLLLRYTIGNHAVRPYVNGGVLYAMNISNQSVLMGRLAPTTTFSKESDIEGPAKYGLGLTGGTGMKIRLGALPELGLEVRYDYMRYNNFVLYNPKHTALRLDVSVGF